MQITESKGDLGHPWLFNTMKYFFNKNWTKKCIFHLGQQILFVITLTLMKKMCGILFLVAEVKTDFKVLWYRFGSHHCKSQSFISAINFNTKKCRRWKDAPKPPSFKVDCSKEQPLIGLWSDLITFGLSSAFDSIHVSAPLTSFFGFASKHDARLQSSRSDCCQQHGRTTSKTQRVTGDSSRTSHSWVKVSPRENYPG